MRPLGTALRSCDRDRGRDGFAMVVVLLTLMALLVLCTPFLLTARNADLSSSQRTETTSVQLALDASGRLAQARLGASHPALDSTPYHDSLEELGVANRFGRDGFLDPSDARGMMFDLDVHDVSGRIDLNSAPPQVIGNIIGATSLTLGTVEADATEMRLVSAQGFLPEGFVWLANGEIVSYTAIQGSTLGGLVRGLLVQTDAEGAPLPCGPRPARALAANSTVIDQRAFALPNWRAWTPDGELRRLDAIEQLRETTAYAMVEAYGEAGLEALERTATVYAGVGAEAEWQHGTRVRNPLTAGESCTLQLLDARWFNEGTTVMLTDGVTTELGLVRRAGRGNAITLMEAVGSDYNALTAVVYPLSRRPVNVNTATPEVLKALLVHLQLRGSQSRITSTEADRLIEVIVESRPFVGFEDFVRRVVLPAGGWELLPPDAPVVPEAFRGDEGLGASDAAALVALIDENDARALYKNALNANDAELAFSTMPFAFVSTEVHAMELRASVNAPSGIQRAEGVREQVELIVPQRDLMFLAQRQEDFDLSLRLGRDAPGWASGPFNTGRHDSRYRSTPPTRSRAHLGPRDTMVSVDPLSDEPVYTFASRDDEEEGFATPWVYRTWEVGRVAGRMLHFDHEEREAEGRRLAEGTVRLSTEDQRVGWSNGYGLMHPIAWSAWIKPESLEEGATFLDVGGPYTDSDRVTLVVEGGDLVLRVLDGSGDHPDTAFAEAGEVRYPLAQGDGPGMPLDTWIHVLVDVRGNRPDQMTLLVDGKSWGRTLGMTRLTGAIGPESSTIPVESTEGFPDPCVLRIGQELIEARVSGDTSFTAVYASEGEYAGFGGRLARSVFDGIYPGVPLALADPAGGAYPEGTPVMLYGYASLLTGNVSGGEGQLSGDLGAFAVGRVVGTADNEQVDISLPSGFTIPLGQGLDDQTSGTLILEPADPGMEPERLMGAFDPNGGYAALLFGEPPLTVSTDLGTTEPVTSANGTPLFGIEVLHYSGWSGNELFFDRRGIDSGELPNLADTDVEIGGPRAFVFEWADNWVTADGDDPDLFMSNKVKIIPISVGVGGAGTFPTNVDSNNPGFVQLTHIGSEAGDTEWVRYDHNTGTLLVRDSGQALVNARFAAQGGQLEGRIDGTAPPTPGTGGGGGGGGTGEGIAPPAGLSLATPPPAPAPVPSPVPSAVPAAAPAATPAPAPDGAIWHERIGEPEDEDFLMTRAVASAFQHRGVMGTFSHDHAAGTLALPTFRVNDISADYGLPGRFDAILMVDANPSDPGFPGLVQHCFRPRQYTLYSIDDDPGTPLGIVAGEPTTVPYGQAVNGPIWVALQESMAVDVPGGTGLEGAAQIFDSRLFGRMTKFPAGELPRGVDSVAVGGGYGGGGGVPSATVDEVYFGLTDYVLNEQTYGAQMQVRDAFAEGSDTFAVWPNSIRVPLGLLGFDSGEFLSGMPEDGGLLKVGEEILAYEGYDASAGVVVVAQNGRGLLGTDEQNHAAGECVTFLQHLEASVLSSSIGGEDSTLPLNSTEGFPGSGLVLIEDELVHFTWQEGSSLGMPAASSEPGAMDQEGSGLFRGRFGTAATGHVAGTPVILFPFRYWDRWTERADAPELHYFGLSLSQPNAFWRSVFWDVEEPGVAGPQLGVLQRTRADVPWDTDPSESRYLNLLWDGMPEGEGNGIGVQSDRIEWRVFVRYEPGAFDPLDGMAHGWKAAPRLRLFGAEYMAPGMVLRRVER